MASAITIPFLHPVLMTAMVGVAFAATWGAPPAWRERRWWPLAGIAIGVLAGALLALGKVVPWTGSLHLSAYAAFMVGGFLTSFAVLRPRSRLIGVQPVWLIDIFALAVALGIVGARVRYVYERWDTFVAAAHGDRATALLAMADFDSGGAVWYGGVILATLGIGFYVARRGVGILSFADAAAPALLAGLAVGRIGCLVNGCCYGAPSGLPWAIPCAHYPGQLVHPTQAYESLACAAMAAGLWWLWGRRRRDGQVAFAAVVGYTIWRFCNEALRGDHDVHAYGDLMTTSQATSIHLVLGTIVVAVAIGWYRRTHPAAAAAAALVPGSRHAPAVVVVPLSGAGPGAGPGTGHAGSSPA